MDMARRKIMVSFALDPDLIKRLELWLEGQELRPSKTAVIEVALKQFLDRQKK